MAPQKSVLDAAVLRSHLTAVRLEKQSAVADVLEEATSAGRLPHTVNLQLADSTEKILTVNLLLYSSPGRFLPAALATGSPIDIPHHPGEDDPTPGSESDGRGESDSSGSEGEATDAEELAVEVPPALIPPLAVVSRLFQGDSSVLCPAHALPEVIRLLNYLGAEPLLDGLYISLKPDHMTDTQKLSVLQALVQHSLGRHVSAAFGALLRALHGSLKLCAFLNTHADGWRKLLPLASQLMDSPGLLHKLDSWLDVLSSSNQGPLAAALPFALLLSWPEHVPLQPGEAESMALLSASATSDGAASSASLDASSSDADSDADSDASSDSAASGGPPPKRARVLTMHSLLAMLTSRLASGLAGNLQAVSEACLLSMARAAVDSVHEGQACEQLGSVYPAKAALEAVLDALTRNRGTLAATRTMCVSPFWDGRQIVLEGDLQAVPVRLGSRHALRCIMRKDDPLRRHETLRSSKVTCTFGSTKLHVRVRYKRGKDSGAGRLFVDLERTKHTGKAPVSVQAFQIQACAVHASQLERFAAGAETRSDRACHCSWTVPVGAKATVVDEEWAPVHVLGEDYFEEVYVCVDFIPVSAPRSAGAQPGSA